jgi:hypothetical protein
VKSSPLGIPRIFPDRYRGAGIRYRCTGKYRSGDKTLSPDYVLSIEINFNSGKLIKRYIQKLPPLGLILAKDS